MINFFEMKDQQFSIYFKNGAPFNNKGLGVNIPALYQGNKVDLGLTVDIWDQDIYGRGGALGLQSHLALTNKLSVSAWGEWKNRGYIMGRQLDKSFQVHFGIELEG